MGKKKLKSGKNAKRQQVAGKKAARKRADGRPAEEQWCTVVGFGASAGGLEAFQEVLGALPSTTGLAFVLIQHLDPKHPSILGELLAKSTKMPVLQVKNRMAVEANKVYVIPPNVGMRLSKGKLLLTERIGSGVHLPIDEFFRSLAEDQGSRAIAVVLSGTASDGTQGLKAVKAMGGITFAQDQTAKFDAMPRNAAAAGVVDLVLPPAQIAREIMRLCQHPYVTKPDATKPGQEEDAIQSEPVSEPGRFDEILRLLRSGTGVDFSLYKSGTLQRRILRRMALHKSETTGDYIRLLRENRAELKALFHDILISVTGFFRENPTFEALKERFLPQIFRDRSAESPVRIWVAGCSTGEEAYSFAMVLLEYMRDVDVEIPVQIFGTDLSEVALAHARAGIYPESIATDVSQERLRRFFTRVDGQYQINRSVRDMCIFAQQNLTKDPPFSKMDLVSCRNVLIYLGPALQSRVMRLCNYALKPSGFLVLGQSETIGASGDLFAQMDPHVKIYARKTGLAAVHQLDFGSYDDVRHEGAVKSPEVQSVLEVQRRVDQYILSRYSPPGVLVTENGTILQFHGRTTPFLEHLAGEPTLNIMRMLRPELLVEFRRMFDRARDEQVTVRSHAAMLPDSNRTLRVTITPMTFPGISDKQYLVLFEDRESSEAQPVRGVRAGKAPKRSPSDRRLAELQDALAASKQRLESVVEEQQATTEELKSANEEVQSSNEELQSTNEELLTAKEELQSTNEELTTVNEEMHSRNAELTQINNDLNNLLSSVNIPIVMLGNDLRIRRFTPQAEKVLNLLPTDTGRPVSDFKPKVDIPDLENLFLDVIENLHVREREVQDRDGRWFSMWIRPYRTSENKIDGAVMVLFDVTERKQAAEARYRRLFEAAKDGIVLADAATGAILDLNPYMAQAFKVSPSAAIGTEYWNLDLFRGTSLDADSLKDLHDKETIQKSISTRLPEGGRIDLEIVANIYQDGARRMIQLNVRDITQRRRGDENPRGGHGAAASQRSEAIGRVATDFTNLLGPLIGDTESLKGSLGNEDAGKVTRIGHSLERAGMLARQLTPQNGPGEQQPQELNLADVVSGMEAMIRLAMSPGFELRVEAKPAKAVLADRAQLEQVILNLVLNAQEKTGGSRQLAIRTYPMTVDEAYAREHPALRPGVYSVLEVSETLSDSGDGLDATTPPSNPERGAVPDIAGVAAAVRHFGGYIWVTSELGRGTMFRIFLPQA